MVGLFTLLVAYYCTGGVVYEFGGGGVMFVLFGAARWDSFLDFRRTPTPPQSLEFPEINLHYSEI